MAKIWIEAYGCSASFADSEMISGIVANGGHVLAESEHDADASILVTCSVKDSTAGRMAYRIKKLGKKPLVVAGCLAKAEPETVSKLAPNASMMGPSSIGGTLQLLDGALHEKKNISLGDDTRKIGLPKVRLNPAVGIVEIASGCMSECTFCQTKLAKGDITSYRVGDVVRQVKEEVLSGCSEIWLSSTDNGCYGLDIGSDLPELVNAVSAIRGDFMIRVGMMNPMYMPRIRDNLLSAYENSNVYKFIHVPVQSGSNLVLAAMKRGHTVGTFEDVVKKMRNRFEQFTISTDIIVGFPTESDDDFEQTVSLLERSSPRLIFFFSCSAPSSSCSVPPIDDGPIMEAFGASFDTVSGSAFARHPATTSGFFPSFFILYAILPAVESFTEHVTSMLASASCSDSASTPPFATMPDIISESAKLAEHPYASIQILAIAHLSKASICAFVKRFRARTISLTVFPVFTDSLNISADT